MVSKPYRVGDRHPQHRDEVAILWTQGASFRSMLFVQPMHGCSNVAPRERKLDTESSLPDSGRPTGRPARVYRLPPDGFAGAPPLDWLANGEAGAASFGFSFLGFFASRLP